MALDPHETAGGSSVLRRFSRRIAIVLLLFTTAAFIGIYSWTAALAREALRSEAESYVDLVVTTRAWNAMHGGTWVLKTAESPSNEYLREVGVEPDTSTVSGTALTLRNPAAMTREISELTQAGSGITFRLVSADPVNPDNAPDAWEAEVLQQFRSGAKTADIVRSRGGTRSYRLLRALRTDSECLTCHAAQGYEEGDLRGAISVEVPMARSDAALRTTALALVVLWVLVVVFIGFVMFWLVNRLSQGLERGEAKLRHMAVTDSLTGLANRHSIFTRLHEEVARAQRRGSDVGIVMIDLDHFKSVNDRWGHAAGDAVLRETALRMRDALREYDHLGRIGGEEFMVVAPEVDEEDLFALGERIRSAVSAEPIRIDAKTSVEITVSVGAARYPADSETVDAAARRADDALYEAKRGGRDRTVVSAPES